jgi:GntR family transcriptional regulator, transcriptional repressor for pyruvate dehydrogenase complex
VTSPLQRVSLADMAVDELIRLIQDRQLKANDTLPSTAELAEALDVSRTVVREAIAELAGQGLLQRRQGRETVVTLPDAGQLERLLRLRFAVNGADFASLQDYREVIEVGAARLAAERATEADIAALAERLDRLRAAAEHGDELHLADQEFHREIARVSGNDMILLTIDGITPLLVQLRQHAWTGWTKSGKGVTPIVEAHATILRKIAEHDIEGAGIAMREHLTQATEGLRYQG